MAPTKKQRLATNDLRNALKRIYLKDRMIEAWMITATEEVARCIIILKCKTVNKKHKCTG